MCNLRYTHCRALLPLRRRCIKAKNTWPTRVPSAGDTLTDSSKKDLPTERGVSAAADEDLTREDRCGGGPTLRFSGGAVRRQPVH